MISITSLTKYYGTYKALDSMDLDVTSGQCIGLLGSNGSGKSTLYRCILGIIDYSGSVKVDGYDSLAQGKKVRGMIGYMPQAASLHNDLTVKQTLQFYSDLRGGSIADAYSFLERVELSEVQQVRVGELSGGMKQRLSFAVAQIGGPQVLLLDEPTVSMDQRSQQILLSWLVELKEEGKTVLLSTHLRQDILSIIDRTITLDHGKIISASSSEDTVGDMPFMYVREQSTNIIRKRTA